MRNTIILIGHRKSPENTNTRFMINRLSQKSDFLRIKLHQLEEKDSHIVTGHHAYEEYVRSLVADSHVVIFDCSDEESLSSKNIHLIKMLKKQEGVKFAISVDVGYVPDMKKIDLIKDVVSGVINEGVSIITYSHDSQFGNGVKALVSEGSENFY